jgi:hypothetical protein
LQRNLSTAAGISAAFTGAAGFTAGMAAVLVGMAVGDFLSLGIPDAYHGYLKVKVHSRQGMVPVHRYHLILNGGNGYQPMTLGGMGGKLHPDLHLPGVFKLIQGHPANEGKIPVSIGVRRGEGYFKSVPFGFAFQGPFQAGDKIFVSVEVKEGFGKSGGINKTVIGIGQGIADTDDTIFNNIHDFLYHITRAAYSGAAGGSSAVPGCFVTIGKIRCFIGREGAGNSFN